MTAQIPIGHVPDKALKKVKRLRRLVSGEVNFNGNRYEIHTDSVTRILLAHFEAAVNLNGSVNVPNSDGDLVSLTKTELELLLAAIYAKITQIESTTEE